MKNKRDGIKEIDKICKAVLKLTDADFEEARKMALEQNNYVHPLKNATAKKYHEFSDHNTRVINALQFLREAIENGDSADDQCQPCYNALQCLAWSQDGIKAKCGQWNYFKQHYASGNKKIIGAELLDEIDK